MKNIYEFEKGDDIVRIQAAKPYSDGGICDRSYMGEKLIFVGILNGQIYLQRTDSLSLAIFGDKLLDLELDLWCDGWDLYVDPIKLLHGIESKLDDNIINEQILTAISEENYELAERLNNILKNKKDE